MSADNSKAAFLDTNILVYAFSGDDLIRCGAARELLDQLMAAQTLRTSTQVLQELFVTLTRKGKPMAASAVLPMLDRLAKFPVFRIDYPAVRMAAELSGEAKLSFWDSLILVAAERSGASILYSEDLQHGRTILGLKIVNPFRE